MLFVILWVMTPWSLGNLFQIFGVPCCLHLHHTYMYTSSACLKYHTDCDFNMASFRPLKEIQEEWVEQGCYFPNTSANSIILLPELWEWTLKWRKWIINLRSWGSSVSIMTRLTSWATGVGFSDEAGISLFAVASRLILVPTQSSIR
jgi:hypothetical protein